MRPIANGLEAHGSEDYLVLGLHLCVQDLWGWKPGVNKVYKEAISIHKVLIKDERGGVTPCAGFLLQLSERTDEF